MSENDEVKILVTGFGPWKGLTANESYEIASKLPSALSGYPSIRIITSPDPIRVSYRDILTTVPKLLDAHRPDIVLHIGLDEGRTFFGIERGASRDGYHQNLDVDRKVFTKGEGKALWGKCPKRLETSLCLDDVELRWNSSRGVMELGKGKRQQVEMKASDDVGDFVCGFTYYASLEKMQRERGCRDVVFLHVPPLKGKGDVEIGVTVVEELIRALGASWIENRAC